MKTKRSLKLSLNPEKILIKRFLQRDKNGTIIEIPEQIFKRVAHAVEVIVHEIPTSHWGMEGEPASEKFKDIS